MANPNKAKTALPYARRILEDQYIQEQLRNAASGLRGVYDRARKQRADATEDKRLYSNLRHAATSIRNASTALQRPEPEPKRRFRKVAVLALSVAGSAWLTMKLQRQQSAPEQPIAPATSVGTPASGGTSAGPIPEPEHAV